MALNALDGMMAKQLNMSSTLGALLNELGDVISDLALYLPLAFICAPAHWTIVTFAIGSLLTEFCGVLSQALGQNRRYEGPMGKSDRAFIIGTLGLVTYFLPKVFVIWNWIFMILTALTLITCWNRLSRLVEET
jgi:phosphatidylglycerophosphate synthase